MADAPCMPLWVSDFLGSSACSEMTGDQQALYLLMLVHAWNMKERGLPADHKKLRKLLGVTLGLWRRGLGVPAKNDSGRFLEETRNILGNFQEESGRLFHKRVNEELTKVRERSDKARDAINERWRKEREVKTHTDVHTTEYTDEHTDVIPPKPSLEDEDPLTPTDVGDKIGLRPGRKKSPRELGTNPRTVAAAESENAKTADAKHRAALIAKLEAAGEQGGAYVKNGGFKLWNKVTTAELEELSN